jgi:hypothetical protein
MASHEFAKLGFEARLRSRQGSKSRGYLQTQPLAPPFADADALYRYGNHTTPSTGEVGEC